MILEPNLFNGNVSFWQLSINPKHVQPLEDFPRCKSHLSFIQRLTRTIVRRFFFFLQHWSNFPSLFSVDQKFPFVVELFFSSFFSETDTTSTFDPLRVLLNSKYFIYPNVFLRFLLSSSSPPLTNYISSFSLSALPHLCKWDISLFQDIFPRHSQDIRKTFLRHFSSFPSLFFFAHAEQFFSSSFFLYKPNIFLCQM